MMRVLTVVLISISATFSMALYRSNLLGRWKTTEAKQKNHEKSPWQPQKARPLDIRAKSDFHPATVERCRKHAAMLQSAKDNPYKNIQKHLSESQIKKNSLSSLDLLMCPSCSQTKPFILFPALLLDKQPEQTNTASISFGVKRPKATSTQRPKPKKAAPAPKACLGTHEFLLPADSPTPPRAVLISLKRQEATRSLWVAKTRRTSEQHQIKGNSMQKLAKTLVFAVVFLFFLPLPVDLAGNYPSPSSTFRRSVVSFSRLQLVTEILEVENLRPKSSSRDP